MSSPKYQAKIVMLGDFMAGKTTILDHFSDAGSKRNFMVNMGFDIALFKHIINSHTYRFQVWDMAGGPRLSQVRKAYFMGASGGIVVFDVNNRESFYTLLDWVETFWSSNTLGPAPTLLIANKTDLRTESSVSQEMVEQFAASLSRKTLDRGFEVQVIESSTIDRRPLEVGLQLLWQDIAKFIESPYYVFSTT